MDHLRSCYSTLIWAVDPGTGSAVQVPIRWYWAPPGAKRFPYHHQYASANWTKPVAYSEKVGEVLTAARPYNKGKVAGTKGTNACGGPAGWVGPMTLLAAPQPTWPWGTPKCCAPVPYWPADGPLLLEGSAGAVQAYQWAADGPLLLEGSAGAVQAYQWAAGGPILLEGSAGAVQLYEWAAGGPILLEGSAGAAQAYQWAADGPLRFRNVAQTSIAFDAVGDGHLTLSGAAVCSQGSAPYGGCSTYPSGCGPKFTIVAAGFTGSCAPFNGTWVLPTPSSGCTWTLTVGGLTVSLFVFGVGSAEIQFSGGGGGAQYATSTAFSPLGSTTMPLQFSGCGSGTAPSTMTCTATS